MKKLIISTLISLLSLSCSISTPDNSSPSPQTPLLGGAGVGSPHPSLNFSDLEKEYKSFNTKALSDAYVSRMFNKFLTTSPNATQVIRQLEFARYLKDVKADPSYFNSLTAMIAVDNNIFTQIDTTSGVPAKKTAESATFGPFVDSLNPVQAPSTPSTTTLTSSGFTANWTAVTGATYDLVVNKVSDSSIVFNQNIGSVITYPVTGLSGGTAYTWKVRAKKGLLSSAYTSNQSVTTSSGVSAGFVSIQGGTFTMGSSEFPNAHQTTLSNFYISQYEVKQSEWASVYNAVTTPADLKTRMGSSAPSNYTGVNKDNHPVENVSWWRAIAYCNAKSIAEGLHVAYNTTTGDLLTLSDLATTDTTLVHGYRLPTEAEWEFVARGGNSSLGYTYSGSNTASLVSVYSASGTSTVGSKSPNELGIYDMSGNVWEWVQDYYVSPYSIAVVTNPYISSGGSDRVMRGGSWSNGDSLGRPAYRINFNPNSYLYHTGFRLCRSAN